MNFIYFNQKYFSEKPEYCNSSKALLIPEPWLIFSNKFIRTICHIHLSPRFNSRIKFPLRRFWMPIILKNTFPKDEAICIIINAHFYSLVDAGLIRYIRSVYKEAFFVFTFSDKYDYFKNNYKDFPSVEKLKSTFDLVITYNTADAEKLGIILDRPCIPTVLNASNVLDGYTSDVFFVGSNKGRIDTIHKIYKICKSNGLDCDFHIMNVPPEKEYYKDDISYNSPIPYSEVLERSSKTKCILNVVQDSGEGVTLRDYEAIHFNKLMLTNNGALKVTRIYNREQMIWIDELRDRVNEIKTGFRGKSTLNEEYSQDNWFAWLESALRESE